MTMVPRDPITVKQIAEAKGGPSEATTDTDDDAVKDAETPARGTGAAPGKLPGSPR